MKTTDYGRTWTSVAGNLPANGNINAVREDYDNPNLLFAGTEFGLFVTVDGGKEWKKFMTDLPSVRVDDVLIHPRDRDLIVATHGRSFWIADDITPLEQLATAHGNNDLKDLRPARPAVQWKSDQEAQRRGDRPPASPTGRIRRAGRRVLVLGPRGHGRREDRGARRQSGDSNDQHDGPRGHEPDSVGHAA